MKRILLISIALISLNSFAFAQEGQQKSLIIINGLFFSEKPELGSWVEKYPDVLFVAVTYESADALVDAVGVGSYQGNSS